MIVPRGYPSLFFRATSLSMLDLYGAELKHMAKGGSNEPQ